MAGKTKQPEVTWLTTKEASEHSNLSRGRIVQLANSGKIEARHDFLSGTSIKAVFIDKASLDAYVAGSNGRSRASKGTKAFVIHVPTELQAGVEVYLAGRGITMAPRYMKPSQAKPEGDEAPVEEEEEETGDEE